MKTPIRTEQSTSQAQWHNAMSHATTVICSTTNTDPQCRARATLFSIVMQKPCRDEAGVAAVPTVLDTGRYCQTVGHKTAYPALLTFGLCSSLVARCWLSSEGSRGEPELKGAGRSSDAGNSPFTACPCADCTRRTCDTTRRSATLSATVDL